MAFKTAIKSKWQMWIEKRKVMIQQLVKTLKE